MIQLHKVDTSDRRDVDRFVQFPFHLYRDSSQWVPPIVSSARKQLNREKHPYYGHSDADFFLALEGGQVVGRIAVLEPRKRNTYKNRRGAFFCMFEAVEDIEVARTLFGASFEWARQRDLEEISGPEGFLPGDGLGLLVKGFEHRPAMGIGYNPAYYDEFVDKAAQGRALPREKVESIARGRVWTGRQALARGLVDELGGLTEAVEGAKRRAGIPVAQPVRLEVFPKAFPSLLAAWSWNPLRALPRTLQEPLDLADALGSFRDGEPLALCPLMVTFY